MTSNNPRVSIEEYGCTASLADSQIIGGLLSQSGFELIADARDSDVNLIVTCTVKTATTDKMVHRIKKLRETGKPLIVAGCMPKTERMLVERIAPEASMIGPSSLDAVVEVTMSALRHEKKFALEKSAAPKPILPQVATNPAVRIIEIASGCLNACTFCQVKIAKGLLQSYRPGLIALNARQAISMGAKEIWLTSTDNGCYGFDIGTNLPELLRIMSEIEGDFMIRVGMMNPIHLRRIEHELIDTYKNPKVFSFLHLPVQSGSEKIVRSMARGHSVAEFKSVVNNFRREINQITISTDIIVGFPGETEEDFVQTLRTLEDIKPDVVNLSKYAARPGTLAASLQQVDSSHISERSGRTHRLIKRIALERNRSWIKWKGEAIVDERIDCGVVCRNFAYKPIIIRRNIQLGSKCVVQIVDATSNCLIGELA